MKITLFLFTAFLLAGCTYSHYDIKKVTTDKGAANGYIVYGSKTILQATCIINEKNAYEIKTEIQNVKDNESKYLITYVPGWSGGSDASFNIADGWKLQSINNKATASDTVLGKIVDYSLPRVFGNTKTQEVILDAPPKQEADPIAELCKVGIIRCNLDSRDSSSVFCNAVYSGT